MRQPVQRADTIAELRDEAACLNELADARREIVHRRVDQRDDLTLPAQAQADRSR